jgi:hypothetical protein
MSPKVVEIAFPRFAGQIARRRLSRIWQALRAARRKFCPAPLFALPVAKAFWRSAFSTCFGGLLGKRDMIRLTALQIILQRGIERRFEGGQQLRNDDLLVEYMPGRSDAEEIAEAIMRVVQRDPEERKLRFHASLLESIAFDDSIDAQFAHHLTSYTASLSYHSASSNL